MDRLSAGRRRAYKGIESGGIHDDGDAAPLDIRVCGRGDVTDYYTAGFDYAVGGTGVGVAGAIYWNGGGRVDAGPPGAGRSYPVAWQRLQTSIGSPLRTRTMGMKNRLK